MLLYCSKKGCLIRGCTRENESKNMLLVYTIIRNSWVTYVGFFLKTYLASLAILLNSFYLYSLLWWCYLLRVWITTSFFFSVQIHFSIVSVRVLLSSIMIPTAKLSLLGPLLMLPCNATTTQCFHFFGFVGYEWDFPFHLLEN